MERQNRADEHASKSLSCDSCPVFKSESAPLECNSDIAAVAAGLLSARSARLENFSFVFLLVNASRDVFDFVLDQARFLPDIFYAGRSPKAVPLYGGEESVFHHMPDRAAEGGGIRSIRPSLSPALGTSGMAVMVF